MKRHILFLFCILGIAVITTDCRKRDTIIGARPTYAFPLLEARLTIDDVIGARPNEAVREYEFGSGDDSTYFFKLIYPDTLDPLVIQQFQDGTGDYDQPVSITLPERSSYLRMLGRSRDGSFFFSDPSVEFVFDNHTNMEFDLTFDSIYTINVETQAKYPFNLAAPITVAAGDGVTPERTVFTITNENTSPQGALTVVFEPTPKYLYYTPTITSKGVTSISGDSVEIFSRVVLPFEGRGNVYYRDTIPYEFEEDLLTSIVDFAFLRLSIDNGIPLEGRLSGMIVDTANYDSIAPLPLYEATTGDFKENNLLIPGATQTTLTPTSNPTTDAETETTDIRIYRDNPITGNDDIEVFANGNAIIIELQFSTSNFSEGDIVKIFSSQYMKLNMGIKTRLNTEINIDSLNRAVRDSLGIPSPF